MNILLLGSGGREHAQAFSISKSPQCSQLFIAPGNPGTALLGINVTIATTDFKSIGEFCVEKKIEMVVVGPEDPLVLGIVDYFKNNSSLQHIPVIGPDAQAAKLEGSKAFAKDFMTRNLVQTPAYKEFSSANFQEGISYLKNQSLPIVLKADGLAAGKGVVICQSYDEVEKEFQSMLQGKFGEAGKKIVVEQYLNGIELTIIILTDGNSYLILPPSKDYKKIGDGDVGLNTGGMGAVSPPPFVTELFLEKVKEKIIEPTMQGLKKEQINFQGFLYFGLFKCGDEPYLIEYNVRMGDPETQVILPRIQNDILELFKAVSQKTLHQHQLQIDKRACTTVVLASAGYPGEFEKNKVISGIDQTENCMVFYAGIKRNEENELITSGGRVLAISAYGETISEALRQCYVNAGRIYYETRYFRRDIGYDV